MLAGLAPAAETNDAADPYRWLEDVTGERALAWVSAQQPTLDPVLKAPGFGKLEAGIAEVLASPARLAPAEQLGEGAAGQVYNFWRDAEHPRGIWRRSAPEAYLQGKPRWETVLDLDRLAQDEGERWVWAGATCLEPAARRCLVSLSRGGGDAHVLREFDTVDRRFVPAAEGGFALPEAKGGAAWMDANTLGVYTDFGSDSMTRSGYPRQLKLWRRGTPLADARLLLEGGADEVGLWAWSERLQGQQQFVLERSTSFFAGKQYLWRDGRLVELPKPDDARASLFGAQALIELRSDWGQGDQVYPAGAVIATPLQAWLGGKPQFTLLHDPARDGALQSLTPLRDALLVVSMRDVRQHLSEWRQRGNAWQRRAVPTGTLESLWVGALAGQGSNRYLLTRSGFLQPPKLEAAEAGQARRRTLQQMPAFFDASGLDVRQLHATSADGTQVPYFIVTPRGPVPEGGRPTLLYGYGGFEISMRPGYNAILGRAWLARGGVYVLANLRGGGEFGPRWHQAALRENRQRSFDDFIAVAEDLQRRGITRPDRLGIMGGSLGGLLTSVALVQRPELFGAVVSQVPLTDMRRYHELLAGASWIEEYGNPDIPEQWNYIGKYSPYQNASADRPYPPVLYTSSTRDDRVHPGHARKMVARLQAQGHEVLYWENTEGGHAGAATPQQQARLWSLSYGFLQQRLMGGLTAGEPAR
ncbi:S9 family peptidase [Pelomonas saccharophila]|nr:S9 family peptidase [Roseateles saccharophilus]